MGGVYTIPYQEDLNGAITRISRIYARYTIVKEDCVNMKCKPSYYFVTNYLKGLLALRRDLFDFETNIFKKDCLR